MKIEITQDQLDATIRQLEAAKVQAELDALALFKAIDILGMDAARQELAEKRLKDAQEAAELVDFFLHR